MAVTFPSCPASLKAIQHYLKTADEHDARDPVISYWCRLYALQLGLTIDKSSKEAKALLVALMEWLEKCKTSNVNNETITNEMAAQAYIENYALKVFSWADNMDRTSNFNKNVVKSFYTAGTLMDILTTFGELSEEITHNRKYAKWKASYIHNCLKAGQTPVAGPSAESTTTEEDELNELLNTSGSIKRNVPPTPPPSATIPPSKPNELTFGFGNIATGPTDLNIPDFNTPRNPHPSPIATTPDVLPTNNLPTHTNNSTGDVKLPPVLIAKAQKYCKFASSALNYDDIPEAITNLEKALRLLQTGKE